MATNQVHALKTEVGRHRRAMEEALHVAIDELLINPFDKVALRVVDILGKRLGAKRTAGQNET